MSDIKHPTFVLSAYKISSSSAYKVKFMNNLYDDKELALKEAEKARSKVTKKFSKVDMKIPVFGLSVRVFNFEKATRAYDSSKVNGDVTDEDIEFLAKFILEEN